MHPSDRVFWRRIYASSEWEDDCFAFWAWGVWLHGFCWVLDHASIGLWLSVVHARNDEPVKTFSNICGGTDTQLRKCFHRKRLEKHTDSTSASGSFSDQVNMPWEFFVWRIMFSNLNFRTDWQFFVYPGSSNRFLLNNRNVLKIRDRNHNLLGLNLRAAHARQVCNLHFWAQIIVKKRHP